MQDSDIQFQQFLHACQSQKAAISQKKVFVNFVSKCLFLGVDSLTYQSSAGGTLNPRSNNNFVAKSKMNFRGISIYVDDYIENFLHSPFTRSDFNVAVLSESKFIKYKHYELIQKHYQDFDLILSYDKEVLACFPDKCRFVPADTISVDQKSFGLNIDRKIAPLSYIYSNKKQTIAHSFRHRVASFLNAEFPALPHFYGTGCGEWMDYKHDALQNYQFSIAIENSCYDYYFTEKILDCFITGTIPLYYGSKSVSSFFDSRGILFFDSLHELRNTLVDISSDPTAYYNKLLKYVNINYLLASQFLHLDDSFVYVILDFLSEIGRYDELAPYFFDPQDNLPDFLLLSK